MRYLEFMKAEANVGGENMDHILVRSNPSKAAILEEFLHGAQHKLGTIDRLGVQGAEAHWNDPLKRGTYQLVPKPGSFQHVKDFMIRHAKILGLSTEDVEILKELKDLGL